MSIDAALRFFISTFRLPGEAQVIDRIMQKFSYRYFSDAPEGFANKGSTLQFFQLKLSRCCIYFSFRDYYVGN